MSNKYTIDVRSLCERACIWSGQSLQWVESASTTDIINLARATIFDFDYPFYSTLPSDKTNFETKFLANYYMDDIGLETYALWKHYLKSRLTMRMPYYSDLYKQYMALKSINIYDIVNMTETHEYSEETSQNVNGSTSNTISGGDTFRSAYSDTPQGGVTSVENNTYLTNYTKNTNDTETESNITTNNDTDGTKKYTLQKTRTGKDGASDYSDIYKKYRDIITNIDEMLINECSDLFMQIL